MERGSAGGLSGYEIVMNPLSLSVSCHIGPGSLAVTCTKVVEA